MNDRHEVAARIIAADLIAKTVKPSSEREALFEDMEADGTKSFDVQAENGDPLGKVVRVAGGYSAKVIDELKFKRWVETYHPTSIMTVVDPAYRSKLLNLAAKEGLAVDPSTGESLESLIEVTPTNGHVKVTPSPEAKETMAGLLEQSGLLQLTSPPEPDHEPIDWGTDE